MKKSIFTTLLSILFSLFLLSQSNAQEFGKLFRKTQADSLYGPVKYSLKIPTPILQKMLKKAGKLIMFKHDGKKFLITDSKRMVMRINSRKVIMDVSSYSASIKNNEIRSISAGNIVQNEALTSDVYDASITADSTMTLSSDDPVRALSVSKIEQLIDLGQNSVTTLEKRDGVISLTNGAVTLEMSAACPPFCY